MSTQQAAGSGPERSPIAPALGTAILTGFVFGAGGMAFSLHTLADRLLPHILTTGPGIEFQEIMQGRPIPRLLDWSYAQIGIFTELREISPWMVAIGAIILGCLLMIVVSILNPTFHPFSRRTLSAVEPVPRQVEVIVASETPATSENEVETVPSASGSSMSNLSEPISTSSAALPDASQAHITVDRIHLEQAIRVLLAVGLPVLAFWFVTGAFGNEPVLGHGRQTRMTVNLIELSRYLVLGVGIFVGYSQTGLSGRFGILHQAYQSDDAAIPVRSAVNLLACIPLVLKGCVLGAAIWGLEMCAVRAPDRELLDRFQALGTFNLAYFNMLARPFIASTGIVWFSVGVMIYLLGKPGIGIAARAALACVPLVGALAVIGMNRPFSRDAMAARYDTTDAVLAAAQPYDQKRPTGSVPVGKPAALEFARRAPVHVLSDDKPAPRHNMVVFDPRGVFEVQIDELTDDGLITEHAKCRAVQAFLDSRKYRSALSWAAIKYLFNDANINFDQAGEIRVGLDDLEKSPHMLNTGETMRAIFFICSASAQNLALLDEYADETRFVHPTRESQRMMGDLYTRFGEVNKALVWYGKADMPHSFIQQVKTEKPLFHTGTVTGKLTWNGAPLAGLQIGVAPQRLNGLPRDLRLGVLHYDEELAGVGRDPSPFFSEYHPRPFHLRWICGGTTTGPDGTFTINHLTEGEYFLVCTLPTGVKLTLPVDAKLSIQHGPTAFTLSYAFPKQDLGVVAFLHQP